MPHPEPFDAALAKWLLERCARAAKLPPLSLACVGSSDLNASSFRPNRRPDDPIKAAYFSSRDYSHIGAVWINGPRMSPMAVWERLGGKHPER